MQKLAICIAMALISTLLVPARADKEKAKKDMSVVKLIIEQKGVADIVTEIPISCELFINPGPGASSGGSAKSSTLYLRGDFTITAKKDDKPVFELKLEDAVARLEFQQKRGTAPPARLSRFEMERDIRETIYRHEFLRQGVYDREGAFNCFLAVGDKEIDPTDEFMQRFKADFPAVKKVSQSERVKHYAVRDKETGERGIVFYAKDIKWLSNSKVELWAGFNASNLGGQINLYTLENKHGRWSITKTVYGPIS